MFVWQNKISLFFSFFFFFWAAMRMRMMMVVIMMMTTKCLLKRLLKIWHYWIKLSNRHARLSCSKQSRH